MAEITGGPYKFVPTVAEPSHMNLMNAHARFKITSAEFDTVASILHDSLKRFNVPDSETAEVLAAFAAHKKEVVTE